MIHWHPYTLGKNAVFGVFLDTYDVELKNDSLKFPENNVLGFTDEYIEDETQCDGEDAELSVRAWANFTDTDGGQRYIANMDEIHLDNDGMVFAVYFAPDDADQTMPPWASDLPQLGAVDSAQIGPDLLQSDPSVVVGDDTVDDDGRPRRPTADVRRRPRGRFGTRLRPLTNDIPKPMLPVVHRPMIVRPSTASRGGHRRRPALGFKPEPFAAAFRAAVTATSGCTTRSNSSRSTPVARSCSQPRPVSTTPSWSPTAT